jgi:hypothetical protein
MTMSRIWEVLTNFKKHCTIQGWRTSENEDWFELNHDYHNFLSTKNVSPTSFKAIITNRKCVVHKGPLYTVVEPSHLAWLFSEPPTQELLSTIRKNPDFSRRVALFDLSPMLKGNNTCLKLNNTDSPIFHEFETFLQNELKVKIEPFQPISDAKINANNIVPQLA